MNLPAAFFLRICAIAVLVPMAVTACKSESGQIDEAKMQAFGRSYTDAWSSQDPARVASHFAENGSLQINQDPPSMGRAALTATAATFMREIPDMVLSMDGLSAEGNQFIYRWTLRGTNTGPGGSGNRMNISGYEEWTMSPAGLILESKGHMDLDDYQRQLTANTAESSPALDAEQESIVAVVQAFFDTMASKDAVGAEPLLIPEGTFHSVRELDGKTVIRTFTNRSYLDELPGETPRFRERMWNPEVRIHGSVATLWTAYDFWKDGTFSHCGIDAFDLVKIDGHWKIAGGVYSADSDCDPSPLGPLNDVESEVP
ncbi:nuclear transport factor 2 family protein [Dokdonella sp.]|uniref:nuclear transport factor 2 family protein n=1 Tax=Dokdonella sp. TaxID=2291710 RepID=UPI003C65D525